MPEAHHGTVLVVDDEPTIVEIVSRYLERAGFETVQAKDGPEALRQADLHHPDLLVLDLMLPGLDGIEVMRQLHERPGKRVAVILLTARGEENDRLVGLRHGADDYVVKPFSPAELVARVEAVMRRVSPPAEEEEGAPPIEHGPLRVEPATRRVFLDGEELSLTMREFDLLAYLAAQPRLLPRPADGSGLGIPLLHRHQHRHRPHPPPRMTCARHSPRCACWSSRSTTGWRPARPASATCGRSAPTSASSATLSTTSSSSPGSRPATSPGRCGRSSCGS